MSSLDEILHYLDTTSRVSCPTITCEQAAEIAAYLREQENVLEWMRNKEDALDQLAPPSEIPRTKDEAREFWHRLRSMKHRIDELECEVQDARNEMSFSDDVACGFAWDCGREIADWKEHALYLERGMFATNVRFSQARVERNEIANTACGFAWDAGRREAELREHLEEYIERDRPKPLAWPNIYRTQATGDIDPGIYEGTGKGFAK